MIFLDFEENVKCKILISSKENSRVGKDTKFLLFFYFWGRIPNWQKKKHHSHMCEQVCLFVCLFFLVGMWEQVGQRIYVLVFLIFINIHDFWDRLWTLIEFGLVIFYVWLVVSFLFFSFFSFFFFCLTTKKKKKNN